MMIMRIKNLIEHNKGDADEIVVVIQNDTERDFCGNPVEKFLGVLSAVPESLFEYEVTEISRIVNSSDQKRIGANCVIVKADKTKQDSDGLEKRK